MAGAAVSGDAGFHVLEGDGARRDGRCRWSARCLGRHFAACPATRALAVGRVEEMYGKKVWCSDRPAQAATSASRSEQILYTSDLEIRPRGRGRRPCRPPCGCPHRARTPPSSSRAALRLEQQIHRREANTVGKMILSKSCDPLRQVLGRSGDRRVLSAVVRVVLPSCESAPITAVTSAASTAFNASDSSSRAAWFLTVTDVPASAPTRPPKLRCAR